uniref:helix-turn-helix domain-containing protein n=1 Tax=Roseivirga sp. TaxID=1964215 RepID=UPI004048C7C8
MFQEDLAQYLGNKGLAIDRYEMEEMKLSIEVAAKIEDYLEVSLDYLVGKTDIEVKRKTTKRILEVRKFKEEEQQNTFSVIDAFIAKRKMQRFTQKIKPE